MSLKISNFPTATSVLDADYLTIVSGDTNKKITYSNFLSGLGVTGSIQQQGDPTAVPVLNTSGTVNNIRNIEPGSGVLASVSGYGGVAISHNFTDGDAGVAVLANKTATQPLIRNLVAGSGINIAASGNNIQITATDIVTSQNVVVVNSMSDFPAAVAGVITLDTNTMYLVSAQLTTANRFVFSDNCILAGTDPIISRLTYTGAGDMFTSTNSEVTIKDIALSCPGGRMFNVQCAGNNIFQAKNIDIIEVDTIGRVAEFDGVQFADIIIRDIKTAGFQFEGSMSTALFRNFYAFVNGGQLFDLGTTTFDAISITNVYATLAGGTYLLEGLASSANINAGGQGTVVGCGIFGAGTPLNGVSVEDALWHFAENNAIPDTRPDALLNNTGTTVTIALASTPVVIGAAWVVQETSQFTATTAGRATYNATGDRLPITFSCSAEPVSGTNKTINFYIAKNGSVITASKATTVISSGSAKNTPVFWQDDLVTGDYIEVFVENATDTTSIKINNAILRIN